MLKRFAPAPELCFLRFGVGRQQGKGGPGAVSFPLCAPHALRGKLQGAMRALILRHCLLRCGNT